MKIEFDANQIIDEFTSTCDPSQAVTVFLKLAVANGILRSREKDIHPDAAWNVDPYDEQTLQAIRAINTLLYEIEKTMSITPKPQTR